MVLSGARSLFPEESTLWPNVIADEEELPF